MVEFDWCHHHPVPTNQVGVSTRDDVSLVEAVRACVHKTPNTPRAPLSDLLHQFISRLMEELLGDIVHQA